MYDTVFLKGGYPYKALLFIKNKVSSLTKFQVYLFIIIIIIIIITKLQNNHSNPQIAKANLGG